MMASVLCMEVSTGAEGTGAGVGAGVGAEVEASEGSTADDAEGFPGGPHDPSVLISFAEHVAHIIWNGEVL